MMQTATAEPSLASFGLEGTEIVSTRIVSRGSLAVESVSCLSHLSSDWTHILVLPPAHFLLVCGAATLSTHVHAHVALRISHCSRPARCQSALIKDMICKGSGDWLEASKKNK